MWALYLEPTAGKLLANGETLIGNSLDVALQATSKVLEHSRAARKNDVLVESSSDVDRALLDDRVHRLRD